jgi:hypothetical protein
MPGCGDQTFIRFSISGKGTSSPTHAAGQTVRHQEAQRRAAQEAGGAARGAREGEGETHGDAAHGAGDSFRDEAARRGYGRSRPQV